jgi:hypothetical protein
MRSAALARVKGGRAGRPVRVNFRREETTTCSDEVAFADKARIPSSAGLGWNDLADVADRQGLLRDKRKQS